ncbi:MAG: hypothetical protein ACOCWR_08965 [Oceanidesulfovibrio sp.]
MLRPVLLTMLLIAAMATNAGAHKIMLNAWAEGDMIATETAFGDGSAGNGASVTVTDAATGEEVLTGFADDTGFYEAQLPAEVIARGNDLRVVSNAGAGHQAETVVPAEEFAAAPATPSASDDEALAESVPAVDPAALRALVGEAVREEIKPLRRELMSMRDTGPELSSIVGGVGYILGLFGVAALVGARRRRNEASRP